LPTIYLELVNTRQAAEVNAAIASLLAVLSFTKHPYLYANVMEMCGDVLTVRRGRSRCHCSNHDAGKFDD